MEKARGPWVAVDKNNNEHMFHKRPVPVDGKYYVGDALTGLKTQELRN